MHNNKLAVETPDFAPYPILGSQSIASDLLLPNTYIEQAGKELNLKMVFVKGGTFSMGAEETDTEAKTNEKPLHEVTLSDFYIGSLLITQEQFQRIMNFNPSHFGSNNEHPVEMVSWYQAREFCVRLNKLTGKTYRLPTEAEWEFAAKGGQDAPEKPFKYAGGDDLRTIAWYYYNLTSSTRPVGRQDKNQLGLYDMSGNVWEWCQDWYNADYYANSPQNNPLGPTTGAYKVLRGGCWCYPDVYCRVNYRNWCNPNELYDIVGFRVVRQL